VSIGRLGSDPDGHIYYGYTYMPEPLVREYDRFGFAKLDFSLRTSMRFPKLARRAGNRTPGKARRTPVVAPDPDPRLALIPSAVTSGWP